MKTYWLPVLLLFPLLSFGQFTLGVQAGANYTAPHLSKHTSFNRVKGGVGWQGGVSANYQMHKLFVYSGLGVAQYRFSEGGDDWSYYHYSYRTLYLQVPAGIGYRLPLQKTKSLMLYGGVQGLLGIAGKSEQPQFVVCFTSPCPQPTARTTKDIRFEKSDNYNGYESFAKTAANLQVGATITLTPRLAAGASYAWGITNAQDFSDYAGTTSLRVLDVNVKYYLVK